MLYREYGSTGIQLSALSMGGMRFEDCKDLDRMAQCLLTAFERGINYFDTAEGYNDGDSERVFGRAIPEMRRIAGDKPFYIATKTWAKEEADVRQRLEASLERLNVDHIDFYHIWCITTWEGWEKRRNEGALESFLKLKDEGLIRHICVSTHMDGGEIERLIDEVKGAVDGILLGYNAANFPYREGGVAAAHGAGMGVVAMNPLGGGMIIKHPSAFDFVRTSPEQSLLAAALNFNISNPKITSSLVGVRNVDDVHAAVDAVESAQPLSDDAREKLKVHISESFNELCTSCRYCDECPEEIPVPRLMEAYNWYLLSGKEKDAANRLKWHWEISSPDVWAECTQCGTCESKCTQHLPIMERLEKLTAIVKDASKS